MLHRLLIMAVLTTSAVADPARTDEFANGFAAADVDGGWSLDVDEYLAAVVLTFAALAEYRDAMLIPEELPDASSEGIARIDRDCDGIISVGEAAGDRIVRFFDAETDCSGLLTLAEVRVYSDSLGPETE